MPVAAAVVVVAGAHELQAVGERARVAEGQRAVVAERDVVAAAEHERVVARAAEHEVAAGAGGDPVVAAERRRRASARGRGSAAAAPAAGRTCARSPAETWPLSPRTTLGPSPASIVSVPKPPMITSSPPPRGDRVVAAERRVGADRQREAARDAVGAVAGAGVAEDARRGGLERGQRDVVEDRADRRHRVIEVQDAAAVAEDHVAAVAAVKIVSLPTPPKMISGSVEVSPWTVSLSARRGQRQLEELRLGAHAR